MPIRPGDPILAAKALKEFRRLCKEQKTTPVLIDATPEGPVYSLKEFPKFRARFKTFEVVRGNE